MPYLYKAREFAINNIAGQVDQQWFKQQRGIFGDDYMLEFEKAEQSRMNKESVATDESEQNKMKLARKMHSLYFPFACTESTVNSFNMMMMSGEVKNSEEAKYMSRALSGDASDIPKRD